MVVIGNILLIISGLLLIALALILFGKPPHGDGLMGYAWAIIILNLAFAACMILVALIIGGKGGFEWVATTSSKRFWIVTICLLTALFTAGWSGLLKYEHGPVSMFIRFYSSFAPILIPIVMIGAGAVLLNASLRASVPLAAYQWPLILISIIGLSGIASELIAYLSRSAKRSVASIEARVKGDDENHNRIMAEIASNDVMTGLANILVFSGDNQPDKIRVMAVEKIKTHPEWQQELIDVLNSGYAEGAFQFLASNDVDDPALFADPVRIGILKQAEANRERIRRCSHPSHFYSGMFSWEVERVVRTVDKFKGRGVDYIPAMKELRSSLDEPSPYEKPKFSCTPMLDKWIKKNS